MGGFGADRRALSTHGGQGVNRRTQPVRSTFQQSIARNDQRIEQEAFRLHQQGRLQEAEKKYKELIKAKTRNGLVYANLASIYGEAKRYHEVIELTRRALLLNPADAMALCNLGAALNSTGRLKEAIAILEKALSIRPDFPLALSNLGNALTGIGDLEGAIYSFHQALAIHPDFPDAYYNLGAALKELGELDTALEALDRAIALQPGHVEAHFLRCLILLLQQRFAEAWTLYEWRWQSVTFQQQKPPSPTWTPGHPVSRLIVTKEQGVGDQIMFCSMIPDLIRQQEELIVLVDHRLVPLMQRSWPDVKFLDRAPVSQEAEDVAYIAMGSLGRFLRPSLQDFSTSQAGFLVADEPRRARLANRFRDGGHGLVCGISWHSAHNVLGGSKSVALEDLARALARPDVRLVSLQYGDTSSEITQLRENTGIEIQTLDEIDAFHDLDGLAALIDACDLVISVSNTTVHLACGLGKPSWVLLQRVPLPRWGIEGRSSPWYPTARLFRQHKRGDWPEVLKRVGTALDSLLRDSAPPA